MPQPARSSTASAPPTTPPGAASRASRTVAVSKVRTSLSAGAPVYRGVRLAHGPPSNATGLVFMDPASLHRPETHTNSLASSASPDWPRMYEEIHPLIHDSPFGGVGLIGKYSGEWGFRAYTNACGVLYRSTQMDLDVRYPPWCQSTGAPPAPWHLQPRTITVDTRSSRLLPVIVSPRRS